MNAETWKIIEQREKEAALLAAAADWATAQRRKRRAERSIAKAVAAGHSVRAVAISCGLSHPAVLRILKRVQTEH